MARKNLIIIGIIIILVLLAIALLVTKVPEQELEEETSITESEEISEPEEAPEVTAPLATRKQVFDIITSGRTFKIVEVEIDPFDVKQGESQQVTAWVEDAGNKPISSENKVEGIAFTDNKETPFSFKLREISDANGGTLTKWAGLRVLEDTYEEIYIVSIVAKSADDEHKIDLTLR